MSDVRHALPTDAELYGTDCADWLARWDAGKIVWSIEMSGIGPGYEQTIQIAATEVLRHMLAAKYDASAWQDKDAWARDRALIEQDGYANDKIEVMGLSYAQWGAALNLASHLYRRGPIALMNDPAVADRHIQIRRAFP